MKEFISIETSENYEALNLLQEPHILYFTSPSCAVCKSISTKLLKMVEPYPIQVYKIDATALQDVTAQRLIFSIPTIIVMKNQKEIAREVRFIQFENLERLCALACVI